MKIYGKEYQKYADAVAEKSPCAKNCIRAFLFGGTVCALAQGLTELYKSFLSAKEAVTLVPITGFANAVSSPAIDTKSEGFILGVGANMFKIAGPVIVYGIAAGAVYGVVYWVIKCVTGA